MPSHPLILSLDSTPQLRLVIPEVVLGRLIHLLSEEGSRISPGLLCGQRVGNTYLLQHVESGEKASFAQKDGRQMRLPEPRLLSWHQGYHQALKAQGWHQLGWWIFVSKSVDDFARKAKAIDLEGLHDKEEYHLPNQPDPLFLTSWEDNGRYGLDAILWHRHTQDRRPVEIDF